MKFYITKYALTKGISCLDAEPCIGFSNMIRSKNFMRSEPYHKPDWHRTRADAIARSEEMRTKKIASLKKQLSRLEKLDFRSQAEKAEAKYHAE